MARNSEKRLIGLNRFVEAKQKEGTGFSVLTLAFTFSFSARNEVKRPPLVSENVEIDETCTPTLHTLFFLVHSISCTLLRK